MSNVNQYSGLSKETRALLYKALLNQSNLLHIRRGQLNEFTAGNPVNVAEVRCMIGREIIAVREQLSLISKA